MEDDHFEDEHKRKDDEHLADFSAIQVEFKPNEVGDPVRQSKQAQIGEQDQIEIEIPEMGRFCFNTGLLHSRRARAA